MYTVLVFIFTFKFNNVPGDIIAADAVFFSVICPRNLCGIGSIINIVKVQAAYKIISVIHRIPVRRNNSLKSGGKA